MLIRDVMTWNVVTVPSDMQVMEARKILEAHGFNRLPVVDKGKLVGLLSRHRVDSATPTVATSLSVWEINYLLAKITVGEVMSKNIVVVTPQMSVEQGVQMAQNRKVGSLIVVEDGKVVGIVTTNDIFYRILNPVLGINKPGIRFEVHKCGTPAKIADVMAVVARHNGRIVTQFSVPPSEGEEYSLVVHLDTNDASALVKDVRALGYKVDWVER
jgi:acetoin utilization protein AcuB